MPSLAHSRSAIVAPAASSQLTGNVQPPDDEPAGYVSVAIQSTTRGTTTGERDQFQLRHLSYDQLHYRVGFKANNLAFITCGAVSPRQLVLNVAVKS